MKRVIPLLLLLGAVWCPAAASIDPFYSARMESGFRAFESGDFEAASRQLRIACFGHLEEPAPLAEGLVRLAIAEARLGDEDAFRRSFSRLEELEERFSAYSTARVPEAVRGQFEELAVRLVPPQRLHSAAGFEALARRADVERLATLPPGERRVELEARLAQEPGRPDLLLAMVRLELEMKRPRPALDWLDRLPAAAAETAPATCLRQQAASEAEECGRTDLTRPFCEAVPTSVVEFRLACLVEGLRWVEAQSLLAGLDPALRARRRVTRLERKVRKGIASAEAENTATAELEPDAAQAMTELPAASQAVVELPEPSTAAATTMVEPPAPSTAAAPPNSPPAPSAPVAARELEALRRRLATAANRAELDALGTDAESFADRHPTSREARLLAAEIAYLRSDWRRAVSHFRQTGAPLADEIDLVFYRAVALYESGEAIAAAELLRPVVTRLVRTRFVDSYVERILGPGI